MWGGCFDVVMLNAAHNVYFVLRLIKKKLVSRSLAKHDFSLLNKVETYNLPDE